MFRLEFRQQDQGAARLQRTEYANNAATSVKKWHAGDVDRAIAADHSPLVRAASRFAREKRPARRGSMVHAPSGGYRRGVAKDATRTSERR